MKFFLLIVVMFFAPLALSAQDLKIAVVDVQKLMNESKAAKSIQKQGKILRDTYQNRIAALEKKLKDAEKKVITAQKEKNEEEFIAARDKFRSHYADSQKEIAELNKKLDTAVAGALKKLQDNIVDIVEDVTEENNYDLVLTHADVIIASEDMDITTDILKRLNNAVKTIKVVD